jgi:hypothetical protein
MKMTDKVIPIVKEEEVVEEVKEVQEVQAENAPSEPVPVIEMTIGMLSTGQLYFNASGNADLIGLEGLMVYARKQLDKMWTVALEPKQKAE